MKAIITTAIAIATAIILHAGTAAAQGAKPLTKCPPDAVVSGTVCMDKYEASVWRVVDPAGSGKSLVDKIRKGTVTATDMTAFGATQLGVLAKDDYAPCADNGEGCADDIFAVSLTGVPPSANMTWFQAQAACSSSAKRLPTNAEWQAAVADTPDPGLDNGFSDCNVFSTLLPELTGSRALCVSSDGAFDMVGNVNEWVAEWMPRSTGCGAWNGSGDYQCLVGAATTGGPGALMRGGGFSYGGAAGPMAIIATREPSWSDLDVGFRCAR